jgi:polysaccharide deacetylase family protein (PEP-CTERM system associated)
MSKLQGALTVDVEDGVNIGMRDLMGVSIPPTERVLKNTDAVLELFAEQGVKGTFFVLGQVAECYPGLIKKIDEAGHEIGVHGYDHYQFFKMDYQTAFDQLDRARKLLQDLTGQEILGHRAPAFSINEKTQWGLEIIAKLGFRYDSSVMPCKGMNYGWSNFNRNITKIHFNDGLSLYEVPMSTQSIWGREFPCLGGSYLRLLPANFSVKSFEYVSNQRFPVIFIHPYELDEIRYPDFFFEALKDKSLRAKARVLFMRLNRKKVADKLARLLQSYRVGPLNNILDQAIDGLAPIDDWQIDIRTTQFEKNVA